MTDMGPDPRTDRPTDLKADRETDAKVGAKIDATTERAPAQSSGYSTSKPATVADILAQSPLPAIDGRALLCHALGWRRTELITRSDRPLDPDQLDACLALINRRFAGEPVAQLVGTREFFGRDFIVTPAVLIPRPDTELLVELALDAIDAHLAAKSATPSVAQVVAPSAALSAAQVFPAKALDPTAASPSPARPPLRSTVAQPLGIAVLDLGTGSGAIAVTLAAERPMISVVATDRSAEALLVAQRNATSVLMEKSATSASVGHPVLPAGQRITFAQGDWFAALDALRQEAQTDLPAKPGQRFDVVVSNPPYIAANDPHLLNGDLRFEPAGALSDGGDGLGDLRHIADGAGAWLKPGGQLLLEHGFDQGPAVRDILATAGFSAIRTVRDLAEHERVTLGVWPF